MKRVSALKLQEKICFLLFGCFVVILTTTSTQAGFQWVPPQKPTPVIKSMPSAPPPPVSTSAPTRLSNPLKGGSANALEPLPGLPDSGVSASAPIASPAPAPVQDNVISRHVMQPTPSAAPRYVPPETPRYTPPSVNTHTTRTPRYTKPASSPRRERPTPSNIAPRPSGTILPDDAPDNARATLDIVPFPDQSQLNATRSANLSTINSNPLNQAARPALPSRAQSPFDQAPSTLDSTEFTELVGFGSDVPLALALSQIVPAGYSYSFAPSIDAGAKVSWDGGKPWNDVVSEMIAPLGYDLSIRGKNVRITAQRTSQNDFAAPISTPRVAQAPAPSDESISFEMAALEPLPSAQKTQTLGTPIGGLPFEQALIEPAAGGDPEPLSASAPLPLVNAQDIAPSAPKIGLPNAAASHSVRRIANPQNIRRSNVNDPGNTVQNSQPAAALDRLANAAQTSPSYSYDSAAPQWVAAQGDSLKETLAKWSTQAGMQLVWDASHDFKLSSNIQTGGSFEDAIRTVFAQGLGGQDAPNIQFISGLGDNSVKQVLVKNRA